MVHQRAYDIGVVGASGYLGHLVLQRLARISPELKVLASSRHVDRLKSLVGDLNVSRIQVHENPVDCNAFDSVLEFVSKVSVVISCAGPFSVVGLPVVRACVQSGTHYVDITGEVDFMRKVIDEFGSKARIGNVLVVPACGFDSVPSDLGVFYAQNVAKDPLVRAASYVYVEGSMSGGTMRTVIQTLSDPASQRVLKDAYALNERQDDVAAPEATPNSFEKDSLGIEFDHETKKWRGPAVMAVVNTRVVRRTASLFRAHPKRDTKYDPNFVFREQSQNPSLLSAILPSILGIIERPFKAILSFHYINRFITWLLPEPGDKGGPSEDKCKLNWFRYLIKATTRSGSEVQVHVQGGDPNLVTAETAVQAAICIFEDQEKILGELGGGGVFTPAFALGARYLDRLNNSDLINFTSEPASPTTTNIAG